MNQIGHQKSPGIEKIYLNTSPYTYNIRFVDTKKHFKKTSPKHPERGIRSTDISYLAVFD